MALSATMYQLHINLSDADRGVYETLELRLARHPSESARYLLTRTLAYCLSYEEGIAFSKGGLSEGNDPPLTVRDPTGQLLCWIDIGAPAADRLHKATKAAARVVLYTHVELDRLRREAASRPIRRVEEIEVWRVEPALLDGLEEHLQRNTRLELVRSGGQLYVTVGGVTLEGPVERCSLV